jgi:hypothetical protein
MSEEDVRGAVETAAEAIALANDAIAGRVTPRPGAEVHATCTDDAWEVVWVLAGPPQRGPDFEAKVTIDAWSGEVTSVLAGS